MKRSKKQNKTKTKADRSKTQKSKTGHTNRDTKRYKRERKKDKNNKEGTKRDKHGRGGKKIRKVGTGAYRHAKFAQVCSLLQWRALAKWIIKNTSGTLVCTKQIDDDKTYFSVRLERQEIMYIFPVWEKTEDLRTPPASSRPLDHGSTWFLRGSLALPDTKRAGRGLSLYREIERLSSQELIFISVLTVCNEKKQLAPPAAVWKKKEEKITPFFSFLPTAAVRGYLRLFLGNFVVLKEKLLRFRVPIVIGLTV